MGGNYIEVPGDYDTNPKGNAISHPTWPEFVPLSAFHLPEVCRQIYSETAVLAYKLNIFVVGFGIGRSNSKWVKSLLPAQRNAITAIAPTDSFLDDYICGGYGKTLNETFPALKFIEVTGDALSRIMCFGTACMGTENLDTPEKWQEWIMERIKKTEGDDIEFEFGEKVDLEDSKAGLDSSDDDDEDSDDDEGVTLDDIVQQLGEETDSEDEEFELGGSEEMDGGNEASELEVGEEMDSGSDDFDLS